MPAEPTTPPINIGNHASVCKHAIIGGKIVSRHCSRVGDAPVMRIVKIQAEPGVVRTILADPADQIVRVPFMDDGYASVLQCLGDVEVGFVVERAADMWVEQPKVREGLFSMVSQEIGQAPAAARLEDADVVSPIDQFGCDAAQKVRVAVIPVGQERVGEDYETHAILRIRKSDSYTSKYSFAIRSAVQAWARARLRRAIS